MAKNINNLIICFTLRESHTQGPNFLNHCGYMGIDYTSPSGSILILS